jgi:glycerate kinase
LDAKLKNGIDAILELYNFKAQLSDTDLIITGEGKIDGQSFQGKVLSGILRAAGDVPVWSICGVCDLETDFLSETGVVVFEASEGVTVDESMREASKYLRIAACKAMAELRC